MTTQIENNRELRRCSRCIMDSSVAEIEFDESGVCNFCHLYDELDTQYPLNEEGKQKLQSLVDQIKSEGKGKRYDCIIGVSGGTDSSYTLILLKQLGLRPLAAHFDNGWNTEISVSNIKNALERLKIDLITYVIDWEEFKDLQLSFLKASVPEVEVPTDLGIRSVLYRTAAKQKVKYVFDASSFRTEGIVPLSWGYKDGRYIKSIQKKYGTIRLKTFPNLTLFDYLYFTFIKKIQFIRILNYFEYSKEAAKVVLSRDLGWTDYGGHHFESHYTRFFQSYIAPQKFKMDRRMVTLSARINSGQITREQALKKLSGETLSTEKITEDKEYIAKKMRISISELENILSQPNRSVLDFPSYYPIIKRMKNLIKWASKRHLLPGFFQGGNFR